MRFPVGKLSMALLALALGACGDDTPDARGEQAPAAAAGPPAAVATVNAAPTALTGAAESDTRALLQLRFSWLARVVVVSDREFVETTVYDRRTEMSCPITAGDTSEVSYFAAVDGRDPTQVEPGGAYQPWWNEDCTGQLVVNDTYHFNDPTLAGEEPVVHTTGTRPLATADAPLTLETDLNKSQTRYFFPVTSAQGFRREAGYGAEAADVPASTLPALLDFTVPGSLRSGKREFPVNGGVLTVEWEVRMGVEG